MRSRLRTMLLWNPFLITVLPLLAGCAAFAGKGADSKTEAKSGSKPASKSVSENIPAPDAEWNQAVLNAIQRLPIGGGYSTRVDARDALLAAIAWEEEGAKPVLSPKSAQPSFCSGATYLAFLVALAQEQKAGRLSLTPEVWRQLIVEGQADGQGVWGRWNANGPGTARLFHELGLGTNFTDLKKALPGDFLKIFWNDGIGASEKGHSVVFMGSGQEDGVETVTFWSSNLPGGYGSKTVPRTKIHRLVFSRLEAPQKLEGVGSIAKKDVFLSSLEQKSVTPAVAAEAVGLGKW